MKLKLGKAFFKAQLRDKELHKIKKLKEKNVRLYSYSTDYIKYAVRFRVLRLRISFGILK